MINVDFSALCCYCKMAMSASVLPGCVFGSKYSKTWPNIATDCLCNPDIPGKITRPVNGKVEKTSK